MQPKLISLEHGLPYSPGLNVPTTPSTYSAGRYGVSCADRDRDGDMIWAMLDLLVRDDARERGVTNARA